MSAEELQEEEREALLSIYDGDELFKELTSKTFQYKYGESDTPQSFLLEIKWGEKYPDELPEINMDTFYNKHIVKSFKQKIVDLIKTEAEQYLGMSMTYTIFEFIKEKFEDFIPELNHNNSEIENRLEAVEKLTISDNEEQQGPQKIAVKKEQLTKAQKRRQWNKLDNKGEKSRGWNWVDIVKHLSQTGVKNSPSDTAT